MYSQVAHPYIETLKKIPANTMKRFSEFAKWAEESVFYLPNHKVHVEILLEANMADLEKNWPLGYKHCIE